MGLTRVILSRERLSIEEIAENSLTRADIELRKFSYTVRYVRRILAAFCFLAISTNAQTKVPTHFAVEEYKWKKAPQMK